jgi:hypothetical protein
MLDERAALSYTTSTMRITPPHSAHFGLPRCGAGSGSARRLDK